jgi:hypothetical protein
MANREYPLKVAVVWDVLIAEAVPPARMGISAAIDTFELVAPALSTTFVKIFAKNHMRGACHKRAVRRGLRSNNPTGRELGEPARAEKKGQKPRFWRADASSGGTDRHDRT